MRGIPILIHFFLIMLEYFFLPFSVPLRDFSLLPSAYALLLSSVAVSICHNRVSISLFLGPSSHAHWHYTHLLLFRQLLRVVLQALFQLSLCHVNFTISESVLLAETNPHLVEPLIVGSRLPNPNCARVIDMSGLIKLFLQYRVLQLVLFSGNHFLTI